MNSKKTENKKLIQAILALKTKEEAKRFLCDLMTPKEILEFSNRLRAAEMLTEGVSYVVIEEETGLSSTTVARVSKCLNGKEGGYRTIIGRFHHHNPIQLQRGLS